MQTTLGVLERFATMYQSDIERQFPHTLAQVAASYITCGLALPLTHAWRHGKIADSAKSMQFVDDFARECALSPVLTSILELANFVADIGRLIVYTQGGNQLYHGKASARELVRISGGENVWVLVVAEAVTYHSLIRIPEPDAFMNDAAYHLCLLLRDHDKLGVWLGKGKLYVESKEEIARQLVAHATIGLVDEPSVPDYVIEMFENGMPIDRSKCNTYLGFMVQFLAWKFDFNFEVNWKLAKAGGAPRVILNYIRLRLVKAHKGETWERIRVAAKRHGIS
jgi:hypothetical protein